MANDPKALIMSVSILVSELTTAGIYNFNINYLPNGIIIYDDLKQVEITKFSFKWD